MSGRAGRIVRRQLVRAVTSSILNLEEAQAESSDADFVAKMQIALREIKETRVAIRLIIACELPGHRDLDACEDEARQLGLIFAKIIVNKKANISRHRQDS